MTFFSSLIFKHRIRNLSFVCLLIFFSGSMQNTVFGQEASLAETVFERYHDTLTREDIQEGLPAILNTLKDPAFQSDPLIVSLGGLDAALDLVLGNPDLLLTFLPGIDPHFITLLKTDDRIRAFFGDPDVRALMKDPDAVKELARLLGIILSPDPTSLDVDADGKVTVVDLAIVALFYGTQVPDGVSVPADVNSDGTVDILDLTAVAQAIDAANNSDTLSADDVAAVLEAIAGIEAIPEAPARHALLSGIASRNVAAAFEAAKHLTTDDARFGKWMPMLRELLHRLTEMRETPNTTALLPNYPNPFNPETWIPYHLSKGTEVTLTIYDVRGVAVRKLTLGHQAAGVYQSRGRAAYWDGRNESGEPVASGVYFYTLTAGEFTATRKLLIAK